jgi:hypothetical protein
MASLAPRAQKVADEINAKFPELGKGGTYPGHGEDPPGEGYAIDFWTTDRAVHDRVFKWLMANGKRLGLWYTISWERIYSFKHPERGVQAYTRYGAHPKDPSQGHRNHVHVSCYVKAPSPTPAPEPTTGVPLMATATAVKVSYKGAQALDGSDTQHVYINAATDKTIVKDESAGIDLTATVEISGLAVGESVDVWWSREWKKSGSSDRVIGGDLPITVDRNGAVQIRYADKLAKADTGWIACLRLRYAAKAKAAKVAELQVRGWKL